MNPATPSAGCGTAPLGRARHPPGAARHPGGRAEPTGSDPGQQSCSLHVKYLSQGWIIHLTGRLIAFLGTSPAGGGGNDLQGTGNLAIPARRRFRASTSAVVFDLYTPSAPPRC